MVSPKVSKYGVHPYGSYRDTRQTGTPFGTDDGYLYIYEFEVLSITTDIKKVILLLSNV